MTRILKTMLAAALLLTAFLSQCDSSGSTQTAQGGSGSEIVGVVQYPDSTSGVGKVSAFASRAGLPLSGGMIFLYPRSATPPHNFVTDGATPKVYTGANGAFRITNLPAGEYLLEATDGLGMGIAREITLNDGERKDVGVITLAKTAALKIRAEFGMLSDLVDVLFYVGVKGTRFIAKGTENSVDILLDGVPTGTAHDIEIEVVKPYPRTYSTKNITLSAGSTLVLDAIAPF